MTEDDQSVSFNGTVRAKLFTMNLLAADLTLENMLFDATLVVVDEPAQALKVVINQITLGTIVINSSSFGKIDMPILTKFINKCIGLVKSPVNSFLDRRKCEVPQNIMGLFNLTDLKMTIHDNYLDLGLTPVFKVNKTMVDERFLSFEPITYEPITQTSYESNFNTFLLEHLANSGEFVEIKKSELEW